MFQSKKVSLKSKKEFLYFISSPVHLNFLPFDSKNTFTGLFIYLPVYLLRWGLATVGLAHLVFGVHLRPAFSS